MDCLSHIIGYGGDEEFKKLPEREKTETWNPILYALFKGNYEIFELLMHGTKTNLRQAMQGVHPDGFEFTAEPVGDDSGKEEDAANLNLHLYGLHLCVKGKSVDVIKYLQSNEKFIFSMNDTHQMMLYCIKTKWTQGIEAILDGEATQTLFRSLGYKKKINFIEFFSQTQSKKLKKQIVDICFAKNVYSSFNLLSLAQMKPLKLEHVKTINACLTNSKFEDFDILMNHDSDRLIKMMERFVKHVGDDMVSDEEDEEKKLNVVDEKLFIAIMKKVINRFAAHPSYEAKIGVAID
jgi:hypothetical protein